MKPTVLLLTFILFVPHLYSQNKRNAIELTPYFRYSNYGTFNDWYGRSFATRLKLKGTSYGLNADYIMKVSDDWQGKIGIGYYKYSFNHISNVDNRDFGGKYPKRPFEYPHPDALLFYTDNYCYNTITANIGWDRIFPLNKGYVFTMGVGLQVYYTYSQSFKVAIADNANYPDYKRKNSDLFGFSASLNLGITKEIGNFYLGPKLLIPLFDQWKQDKIFLEDDGSRSKWLSGIGGGVIGGIRF